MKSIHIRNIETETIGQLKRLARSNHRSLQGELHAILERAAQMAPQVEALDDLPLVTVNTGGVSTWRREEIYGATAR